MSTQTIALPNPSVHMAFDGERFVTGVPGEIAHEHYLRYLFAMQFCAGKDVLDIASGEGYGSSILGQVAATVQGTDLLPEAVEYAMKQYGSDTIRFSVGDVREIPHSDDAFDVVVSFETIEHVAEHERFIEEVKRVLRPGGLLVLSAPNRDVYLHGQPANSFHRREPDRAEFTALLQRFFGHQRVAQQRPLTGAVLFADDPAPADRIATFAMQGSTIERQNGLGRATYLVGLASDGALPDVAWGILVDINYVNRLHAEYQARTGDLQDEQRVYQSEIARLTGDVEARTADIGRLSTDIDFLKTVNAALRKGSATLEANWQAQIDGLVSALASGRTDNAALNAEVMKLTAALNAALDQLAEADRCYRDGLDRQRTRLLTDVLEIFS